MLLGLDKTEINKRLKKTLEGATPTIACIVTGKSRITNNDFLKGKISRFGSIELYRANYISREALTLLKEGKSQAEVRQLLEVPASVPLVSSDALQSALKYYTVSA